MKFLPAENTLPSFLSTILMDDSLLNIYKSLSFCVPLADRTRQLFVPFLSYLMNSNTPIPGKDKNPFFQVEQLLYFFVKNSFFAVARSIICGFW